MPEKWSDGTASPDEGYKTIRREEEISEGFRSWYWDRVEGVLEHVFNVKKGPSSATIYGKLAQLKRDEHQSIFYHSDPLAIAADLAGRRGQPITYEEKLRYDRLVGDVDKPPDGDLRIAHPED